jgi:hypothetical protein
MVDTAHADPVASDPSWRSTPGVVASDADLLPGHAPDAVGADSAADPVVTRAVGQGARRGRRWDVGVPAWNRWAGVAIFNDWCGRAVL